MHHYSFHIGDYRKDTANLNLLEHGVYRTMIDSYYMQETPLDPDHSRLCRLIGARTADEKEAVTNILIDYFTLTPDGYCHSGCDKVLAGIYGKSAKARHSVALRWEKHRQKLQNGYDQHTNVSKNGTNVPKTDTKTILPINPLTHNPLTQVVKAPAVAGAKPSKGSRLSSDWLLPKALGDWAIDQGMTREQVMIESDKFRDYWISQAGPKAVKADWAATWRNWIRNRIRNRKDTSTGFIATHTSKDWRKGLGDDFVTTHTDRTWADNLYQTDKGEGK